MSIFRFIKSPPFSAHILPRGLKGDKHQKGGMTMEVSSKITPEMNLTCELMAEMERAEALLSEVRSTLDEINVTWAEVRAKLNQPTDGADG